MSRRPIGRNELVLTFGVDPRTDEVEADMVRLDGVPGLQPADLREIESVLDVTASVEPAASALVLRVLGSS